MSAYDTITNALSVLIPDLNVSNGSIENKIIDVVASYADSERAETNNSVRTIQEALNNQKNTQREYYRRKASEYQAGDPLKYDSINQGAYYDPINLENRIINQAYITGEFPLFTLLVNTLGDDGHLRRLDASELAGFTNYFREFQPLGMDILVTSLDPAVVQAPDLVIYVRSGVDTAEAADGITQNLLDHEATFRTSNPVSLTEIEDVIRLYDGVEAVSLGSTIRATEMQLNGQTITTYPTNGIFYLLNGAFTFGTEITVDRLQIYQ